DACPRLRGGPGQPHLWHGRGAGVLGARAKDWLTALRVAGHRGTDRTHRRRHIWPGRRRSAHWSALGARAARSAPHGRRSPGPGLGSWVAVGWLVWPAALGGGPGRGRIYFAVLCPATASVMRGPRVLET